MATCPNCGNQTGEGAIFCDQCGTRIPAPEAAAPEPAPAPAGGSVICPACGAGNVPGEAFCDFCGSPLDAPVPSAEVEPALEPVSTEAELQAAGEGEVPAVEVAAAPVEEPALDEARLTCPACGADVQPDEAFCADCGASLAAAPLPPEPVAEVEVEPEPAIEEGPPEPEAEAVPPEVVPEAVVEEAPPEPVVQAAPPAPAPPAPLTCPACGAEVEEDDAFCSSCGAVLGGAPAPVPVVEEAPALPPSAPAGPRLIVSASGAEIPLSASGEMLIGREDPVSGIYPDIDMTPHGGEDGGISRKHARLIMEGGNYFIEDLDSTNFTFVNKQKLAPKTRHQLNDGDEVRCGRVAMVFQT
jgi:hypothetical protein